MTPPIGPWAATQLAAHACRTAADTVAVPDPDLAAHYTTAADLLDAGTSGVLSAFAALLPDDLTEAEAQALADGLTHSSIPDALATMLDAIRGDAA